MAARRGSGSGSGRQQDEGEGSPTSRLLSAERVAAFISHIDPGKVEVERLTAHSDAAFSIFATLMVVPLAKVEEEDLNKPIHDILQSKYQSVVWFAVTFTLVSRLWLTHLNIFSRVKKIGKVVQVVNVLSLLCAATTCLAYTFTEGFLDETPALVAFALVLAANVVGHVVLRLLVVPQPPELGAIATETINGGGAGAEAEGKEAAGGDEAFLLVKGDRAAVEGGPVLPRIRYYGVLQELFGLAVLVGTIVWTYSFSAVPLGKYRGMVCFLPLLLLGGVRWLTLVALRRAWPEDFRDPASGQTLTVAQFRRRYLATEYTVERISAFTDGVFVIAGTLIFLEVRPSVDATSFLGSLHEASKDIESFMLSFAQIGFLWVVHYEISNNESRLFRRRAMNVNQLICFFVSLLPFCFSLMVNFEGQKLPVQLAAADMVIIGLLLAVLKHRSTAGGLRAASLADQLRLAVVPVLSTITFLLGVFTASLRLHPLWATPPLLIIISLLEQYSPGQFASDSREYQPLMPDTVA